MKFLVAVFILIIFSASAHEVKQEMPTNFHGTWDVSENSCLQEYSDMRIVLTESQINYWETIGRLKTISIVSVDKVEVVFTMMGEEEIWASTIAFVLTDGGTKLTERRKELINPIIRVRCNN